MGDNGPDEKGQMVLATIILDQEDGLPKIGLSTDVTDRVLFCMTASRLFLTQAIYEEQKKREEQAKAQILRPPAKVLRP